MGSKHIALGLAAVAALAMLVSLSIGSSGPPQAPPSIAVDAEVDQAVHANSPESRAQSVDGLERSSAPAAQSQGAVVDSASTVVVRVSWLGRPVADASIYWDRPPIDLRGDLRGSLARADAAGVCTFSTTEPLPIIIFAEGFAEAKLEVTPGTTYAVEMSRPHELIVRCRDELSEPVVPQPPRRGGSQEPRGNRHARPCAHRQNGDADRTW